MATISPFRGLLYNPSRIPDLRLVITPPYDVIGPEKDEELRRRDPYNAVHLILPRPEGAIDRYRCAAELLAAWRKDEVLVQDEEPGFYLVSQKYTVKGLGPRTRFGLVARVRIEDERSRTIRPHEQTMAGPRTDRLGLLEATQTNLSPIFLLYSDPQGSLSAPLEAATARPADRWAVDDAGTEVGLWRISGASAIAGIVEGFSDRTLWIADGHHRYEAARAYRDRMRSADHSPPGSRPYDFIMAHLTSMESPGVTILPYHRAIHHRARLDRSALIAGARRHFNIKEFPFEGEEPRADQIRRRLRDSARAGRSVFAACTGAGSGSFLLLILKEDIDSDEVLGRDVPGPLRDLDVSILHHLLLHKALGITFEEQREEAGPLRFTDDIDRALAWVDAGEAQVAFLLNSTRKEHLVAVADAGLQMPQKSTYFYPKVLTGLVFNPHEPLGEARPPAHSAAARAE